MVSLFLFVVQISSVCDTTHVSSSEPFSGTIASLFTKEKMHVVIPFYLFATKFQMPCHGVTMAQFTIFLQFAVMKSLQKQLRYQQKR